MAVVMDTQQQPAGQEAWEKEKEPAVKVRTPLVSEILKKVNNAKAKPQKVKILQQHDSESLRTICKMSFDPMIISELPEGNPPFIENEAPDGTEHTKLSTEYKKPSFFSQTFKNISVDCPCLTPNSKICGFEILDKSSKKVSSSFFI